MPRHEQRATRYIAFDCPNRDGLAGSDEFGCGGGVELEAEWEPGEVWGADADGNRGVWKDGYWTVGAVPDRCTHGCDLTNEQLDHLANAARRAAED